MSQPLVIVVTGANRGIGQGIVQLLAKTQHPRPLLIYATSRSGTNLDIQAAQKNEIHYSKLDVNDKRSISSFLNTTLKDHAQVDVLINNAGINNNNGETPDLAAQVIDVNYRGTRDMCTNFLVEGYMSQNPASRIVNVSSTASQLSNYSSALQDKFKSVKSREEIDALAEKYVSDVRHGEQAQAKAGWGSGPRSYQVSKALINAATVVLAQENQEVLINCCCPGWVDTDMGHQVGNPPKTLEEGARIPVRLAIGQLGPSGDQNGELGTETEKITGKYYGNDGVGDKGWGKVREW
ncbi:hypothetical protein ACN47E_002273 [Coniothyrium glycines]